MISNKARVERRHLLYCDFLGFSNYSLSKSFDPVKCLRLFRGLDKMVDQASVDINPSVAEPESRRVPDYVVKPEAMYFSDAIVISTPPTNIDAIWLCEAAAMIQNQICHYGFLIRGSIVTDDVYHSGQTLFGPAIARAAAIEKRGGPPVIVVSDETLKCFRHAKTQQDKEIVEIREYQLIACQNSRLRYVDPFWLAKIHTNQPGIHDRTRADIDAWRTLIEAGLHNPMRVRRKYSWMARHFNRCLSGKASGIAPIRYTWWQRFTQRRQRK